MNCYLCLVEQKVTTQSAYALCQRCGAGVCDQHLVELVFPPTVGPGGTSTPIPRYTLMCCRCAHVRRPRSAEPQMRVSRRPAFSIRQWWRQFWYHSSPLPEPAEAVKMVEQFLEGERKS